jgi:16S rRNA (cytidine1402-2'-O)-methyltransferase
LENKSTKSLILIPCWLDESRPTVLSSEDLMLVYSIHHFVAERAKTARAWLKAIQHPSPQSEIKVIEWGKHDDGAEAILFFKQCMDSGETLGYLSEAGSPAVADPGTEMVKYAHKNSIQVIPLAGPSSILMALMGSGLTGNKFTFHGYLSAKKPDLARELKKLEQDAIKGVTQIFIETPYRNTQVFSTALEVLGDKTLFSVCIALHSPFEFISTKSIGAWKKHPLEFREKHPVVFVLGVE